MNKTLIYIIGAGRSGTTLLDVLLGNADNVFSGGEMTRYPFADGIVLGLEEQPERTRFWRKFGDSFLPLYDLNRQKITHHEVEFHFGFLKRHFGLGNKELYAEYQKYLREFFATLFDSIEEDIIVDSSKYPGRAIAVSDTLPYRICYLYIRRDPVRVIESFAKTDMFIRTKSWGSANLYYYFVNHLCKIALKKLRKKYPVYEIRYEDLVTKPEEALQSIGDAFSLDTSSVIQKVAQDDYLTVGNLFAGNTLRMQEKIKLRRGVSQNKKNFRNWITRLINLTIYP